MFKGTVRHLTHWEQLDHGLQYTPTRKFLTIVPIVLFFLASFYTHYEPVHFILNSVSLAFVLVKNPSKFYTLVTCVSKFTRKKITRL